jgi:hypothetical protein
MVTAPVDPPPPVDDGNDRPQLVRLAAQNGYQLGLAEGAVLLDDPHRAPR